MRPTVFNLKILLAGEYTEVPFRDEEVDAMFAKLRTCGRKEAKEFARHMVPALEAESDEARIIMKAFLMHA